MKTNCRIGKVKYKSGLVSIGQTVDSHNSFFIKQSRDIADKPFTSYVIMAWNDEKSWTSFDCGNDKPQYVPEYVKQNLLRELMYRG